MQQETNPVAGLKVLVVDDTATNRQILQVFLRKLGCQTVLAEDGAKAVEKFSAESPDLVFMDVMMPIMDGYEATRRIKALASDRWVPVVFLSALDKEENLVAGLEAGGDDYLAKPVNFVVLDAKLRSIGRTLALQRSLEETRRRTEAITQNIVDGIITIDSHGVIRSINPAVANMFGYEQMEELVGRNVNVLMPEPYHSAHDGYLSAYVHGGPPTIIGTGQRRVPGRRRDGGLFPMELGVTELRVDGERLFVGIARDVSEQVAAEVQARQHTAMLQSYHDEREAENALAGDIMLRLMHRSGLSDKGLHHWLMPASHFSGDVVAAVRSPQGKLYALLADATGHGLAAAISVLPVLTAFYSLAEQDFPLGYIAYEVNRQLMAFMPTGRFVAASLVCVDAASHRAELWLGGLPDLLLIGADGGALGRFKSMHPPLGIVEFDEAMAGIERIECPPGSQLALFSDGLIEAGNEGGNPFGQERLASTLAGAPADRRVDAVRTAFNLHMGEAAPEDDVSLLLVDC